MTFQIEALDHAQFEPLFALGEEALRERGAVRVTADTSPGFPCRVSLEDAEIGETLVLLNYRHLETSSPYSASHAIFVRQGARRARPAPGEVPAVLARRLLSVRAYDGAGFMVAADVVEGISVAGKLNEFLEDEAVDFVDIHNAKPGCFAARCVRAADARPRHEAVGR